ncbi:MAG: aminotransferase class-III, partial [Firmicutes bacterium]|nr:aminotransferase class-III [Bacillota bacterium]
MAATPIDQKTILKHDLDHVWHPMAQHQALEQKPPLLITGAEGACITDAEGHEIIDGMAGLWCVNVGYGRKEIAEAVYQQMLKLAYYPHTQANVPAAEFAEYLSTLVNEDLRHIYFVNSGSEANEAAFKLARQYHKQTGNPGKYKIIGRYYSYHGTTMATLGAGAIPDRKAKYEPISEGFIHVQPPYCYRCPFGQEPGTCGMTCAKQIEYVIEAEGAETVAAIVMEPIQSSLGIIVPPDEYMPMVEAICRKHNVLLIVDEVINGFGRTGKWFAHQHWGIKPDIMAVAKGISSGYLPLAATFVSDRIFQAFKGEVGEMRHAVQVNTFGGHPAACAAGMANVKIMERENLPEKSAAVGAYMLAKLRDLQERTPYIGDLRAKGLFIGIE